MLEPISVVVCQQLIVNVPWNTIGKIKVDFMWYVLKSLLMWHFSMPFLTLSVDSVAKLFPS